MKQPKSSKPRKQRKWLTEAPLNKRQKMVASTLSEELRTKYKKRSAQIRKGDKVKVMRGDFKGTLGEVTEVSLKDYTIIVAGVTAKKADGTDKPRPISPSNVVITELNLEDKGRRAKLEKTPAKK